MENASKALIYAGEILLGVLLLTLMVFMFHSAGTFSDTVDKNIEEKQISEFNAPLEKYRGRTDITAQDVITMGNYAKQYNEDIGSIKIKVIVNNVDSKYKNAYTLGNNSDLVYEFINKYSYDDSKKEIIYFKCEQMTYDEETGLIKEIKIKKI